MNLANLLERITVEEFETEYLEKKVYTLFRNNPEYYNTILDGNALRDRILSGGLKSSECRLVREGTELNPHSYTVGGTKLSHLTEGFDRYLDVAKARALYADGCSLVLYSVDKRFPELARLKNSLMADFRANINMNIYASPSHAVGLPVHEDSHDVLVLQLYGEKDWEIYDIATLLPTKSGNGKEADHSKKEVVNRFTLRRGDLAYIPRGIAHRAVTTSSSSIHLTVGILFKPFEEVFSKILSELSNDEKRLRESFRSFREAAQEPILLDLLKDILTSSKTMDAISRSIDRIETDWINSISPHQDLGLPEYEGCFTRKRYSDLVYRVAYPHFVKFVYWEDDAYLTYPGNKIRVHPELTDFLVKILSTMGHPFLLQDVLYPEKDTAEMEFFTFLVKEGFFKVSTQKR